MRTSLHQPKCQWRKHKVSAMAGQRVFRLLVLSRLWDSPTSAPLASPVCRGKALRRLRDIAALFETRKSTAFVERGLAFCPPEGGAHSEEVRLVLDYVDVSATRTLPYLDTVVFLNRCPFRPTLSTPCGFDDARYPAKLFGDCSCSFPFSALWGQHCKGTCMSRRSDRQSQSGDDRVPRTRVFKLLLNLVLRPLLPFAERPFLFFNFECLELSFQSHHR